MNNEQLKEQAEEYVEAYYSDEEYPSDIKDIRGECKDTFIAGAEWRINSVWHDAKEKPSPNMWFIARIGEDCFDTFICEMDTIERWEKWIRGMNIKRWAYISDLLPEKKGGAK